MAEPRPDKVAVVDEVSGRFEAGSDLMFSEYRGLDVSALAELRMALRKVGGEHKIYKNTLVHLAAERHGIEIKHMLTGPTALTFVAECTDGSPGEAAAVAKALRDFARKNKALVLKGGLLNNTVLGPDDLRTLADLPPRELMLAQVASALAAPTTRLAGLLSALPRNLAYGLKALIDQGGAFLIADHNDNVDEDGHSTGTPANVFDGDTASDVTDIATPGTGSNSADNKEKA